MTLALPIRWVQPDAEPSVAPSSTQPPGEWHDLPAIERATGSISLTAAARTFVRGLASRQAPAPALARLQRERALEAPAGLVHGIAHVFDGARRDGPELTPAPPDDVKRRRPSTSWSSLDQPSDDAPQPELGPPVADAPVEAAPVANALDPEPTAVAGAPAEEAPVANALGPEPAPVADAQTARIELPKLPPLSLRAVEPARAGTPRTVAALTRVAETAPIPAPPVGRLLPALPAPAPSTIDGTAASPVDSSGPAPAAPAEARESTWPAAPPPLQEFRPRRVRGASVPPPGAAGPGSVPAAEAPPARAAPTPAPATPVSRSAEPSFAPTAADAPPLRATPSELEPRRRPGERRRCGPPTRPPRPPLRPPPRRKPRPRPLPPRRSRLRCRSRSPSRDPSQRGRRRWTEARLEIRLQPRPNWTILRRCRRRAPWLL